MHSIFSRINNVSALLSSCMMALLAAIALSSYLFNADSKGNLEIASVKVYVFSGYFQRFQFHKFYHLSSCLDWWCIHVKLRFSPFRYPTNNRRYPSKKQELAFVNFNVTAGSFQLSTTDLPAQRLAFQTNRLDTTISLEYEATFPLPRGWIYRYKGGEFPTIPIH
jgi:hypothetical protein